jgi:hypothetical protein
MANNVPNIVYLGQPSAAAGGQIVANVSSGPLGRTLVGTATIVLDGATASGTINFIDGVQTFGKQYILPLQSVLGAQQFVASLTLSQVAASSAGTAVYTGTITGGAANALAGQYFTVAGFTQANNNGAWIATASTLTTLTLANPNATAATHAGTAIGGYTVYSSTSAASALSVGDSVIISGFTTGANNGTFFVLAKSASGITVNNNGAVAETNPAGSLSDIQNGTPVLVIANVVGGNQQAVAITSLTVNAVTSTGFTYVLSATGSAANTVVVGVQIVLPGI